MTKLVFRVKAGFLARRQLMNELRYSATKLELSFSVHEDRGLLTSYYVITVSGCNARNVELYRQTCESFFGDSKIL